jgi:predicted Fe-Mo cluster-binding NifX family protein
MKIAIPVWENKVSPVLDTASRLLVVELKEGGEMSRFEIYLDERDLTRRCLRIQGLGIDTLICGAVTRYFSDMLTTSGINIVPGFSGRPDEVLDACFEGKLGQGEFLMPGWSREHIREQLDSLNFKGLYKPKLEAE